MIFECSRENGKKIERWEGNIAGLKMYERHYEIRVEARSGITVVFGMTTNGGFACMPDFGAGCHLAGLKDKFWNMEQLTRVLGVVDGVTVASALYSLADTIDL
jgi:hypothetical protein